MEHDIQNGIEVSNAMKVVQSRNQCATGSGKAELTQKRSLKYISGLTMCFTILVQIMDGLANQ